MAKINQYRKTVDERVKREKELMLKTLREMPIPAVACEKTGIGHSTFYSWRKNDKEFLSKVEEAMIIGDNFLNDLAKSQMVSLMRDKYWPTIKYHLEKKHPEYMSRDSTSAKDESLTKEQEALVRQALRLVSRYKKT